MNRWQEEHLNQQACEEARLRWDRVAKPLHALGRLEDLYIAVCMDT